MLRYTNGSMSFTILANYFYDFAYFTDFFFLFFFCIVFYANVVFLFYVRSITLTSTQIKSDTFYI